MEMTGRLPLPRQRGLHAWRSALLLLAISSTANGFAVTTQDSVALAVEVAEAPDSQGPKAASPATSSSRRRRRTVSLQGTACGGNGTDDGVPCPHVLLGGASDGVQDIMPVGTMPWEATTAELPASARFAALDTHSLGGLFLELHLPGWTLQRLHGTHGGTLTDFLRDLQIELSGAAGIGSKQLAILGIHERFQRLDYQTGPLRRSKSAAQHAQRLGEEVLVRFSVQPGKPGPDPLSAAEALQVAVMGGSLLQGKVGPMLQNATIAQSVTSRLTAPVTEKDSLQRMSAMALPIGISAAFTGILIWLAAW